MKAMIKTFAVAGLAALANAALALPTVTIDSVTQRWPWNNKADITYTVSDGQDLANSVFYRLKFKMTIGGTEYTIDGTTDVGASMNTGTHTVTWTLPAGVQASDCTIYAEVYEADMASGDDYMVVDLATGVVTYEGLLATQADSNGRYTNNVYKTDKLVLRKIAKGGSYRTGRAASENPSGLNAEKAYSPANSPHYWTTDRDYYIGIFEVTQAQYSKFIGSASSSANPVYNVSWQTLRGAVSPTNSPTAGSFMQLFNARTTAGSGISGFDLPTEVMFEIADRAGSTDKFWYSPGQKWSASSDTYTYARLNARGSQSGSSGAWSYTSVGSFAANAFGLFDTAGNMWEWCLDDSSNTGDLADAPDPWTPACGDGNTSRRYRGAGWKSALNVADIRSSDRSKSLAYDSVIGDNSSGFRVAYIVK